MTVIAMQWGARLVTFCLLLYVVKDSLIGRCYVGRFFCKVRIIFLATALALRELRERQFAARKMRKTEHTACLCVSFQCLFHCKGISKEGALPKTHLDNCTQFEGCHRSREMDMRFLFYAYRPDEEYFD